METRRGQKPRLCLVVIGGSRGVLLPAVEDRCRIFCFGESILVTTCFVSNLPYVDGNRSFLYGSLCDTVQVC